MKVYLATAYSDGIRAADLAFDLRSRGYDVVSTWHDQLNPKGDAGLSVTERKRAALSCIDEVHEADVLVVLQSPRARGTYFEAGVAYESGCPVIWVGEGGPIFDALADMRVPTEREAVYALAELLERAA